MSIDWLYLFDNFIQRHDAHADRLCNLVMVSKTVLSHYMCQVNLLISSRLNYLDSLVMRPVPTCSGASAWRTNSSLSNALTAHCKVQAQSKAAVTAHFEDNGYKHSRSMHK